MLPKGTLVVKFYKEFAVIEGKPKFLLGTLLETVTDYGRTSGYVSFSNQVGLENGDVESWCDFYALKFVLNRYLKLKQEHGTLKQYLSPIPYGYAALTLYKGNIFGFKSRSKGKLLLIFKDQNLEPSFIESLTETDYCDCNFEEV